MPKKLPENCLIDRSDSYTVRQPRGVDLRTLASERGLKVNALFREMILDYIAKKQAQDIT